MSRSRPLIRLTSAILEDSATREVSRAVEGRIGDAWDLLGELVGIDSGSDDVAGCLQVAELVGGRWADIGFSTTLDHTPSGYPVLHATLMRDPVLPTIGIIGHVDTVFPPGTISEWPFSREGDRASGPGVADAKGGAIVAWLAVAAGLDAADGLPHLNLRVLLNSDEEIGSVESRPMIERFADEVDLALVYEPGRPDGSLVSARRGARRYRITVTGKAAHSGVDPWAGVNAIEAAAHKILALQALNDRARSVTVTVAVAHGGSRLNVVPDEATLDVDTRLPDATAAEATHKAIADIVAREELKGARAFVETISERPPMTPHADIPPLVNLAQRIGERMGLEIAATAAGGGSDGGFTGAAGIPTLDGLGPVGGGYHTRDEYIRANSLAERAALSAALLASLRPQVPD